MTASAITASGVHYLDQGSGSPLLFVHGAGGNAGVWWQQIAAFAAHGRTLALDLPGFGRSAIPAPEALAAAFTEAPGSVLDAAGVERASIVCQSLGGWSGLRFAFAHPERTERLVLACTMAGVAHPAALASFAAAREKMDERGPASLGLRESFRSEHPAMAYLYDQASAFNPGLGAEHGQAVFAPQTLVPVEALAGLACPVLVIAGEHDPIWPPAALEGIVAAMPDARMEVIAGAGHSPYFEQPDAFNALVAGFVGIAASG
jgi:3-oxoadipate enol-lactonase